MDTVIDTGRLLLRRFQTDDLEAFYQLGSRPEIIRYAQGAPLASRAAALEYMKSAPFHDYATYGYGRFACVWKPTGAVIGFSGIKYVPEIAENSSVTGSSRSTGGWAWRPRPDALRLNLHVRCWVCSAWWGAVHPDNVASARVVTKLGFARGKSGLRYSGLPEVEVDLFARSI